MRILRREKTEQIPEKQERDAVMRSANTEQARLEALKESYNNLHTQYEDLLDLKDTISTDIIYLEGELSTKKDNIHQCSQQVKIRERLIAEVENILQNITQQKDNAVIDFEQYQKNCVQRNIELQEESDTLITTIRQNEIDANKKIAIARTTLDFIESKIATTQIKEENLNKKINEQLSKIEEIDGVIQKNYSELEQCKGYIKKENELLEKSIKDTEEQDAVLALLQIEVFNKKTELNQVNDELQNKRDIIISLSVRERKVNELVEAIKPLYEKAGIKLDL